MNADETIKLLNGALDWINSAPHGDNCFVSDHYEGDPGNRCNCGKDSLVEALADATSQSELDYSGVHFTGHGMLEQPALVRVGYLVHKVQPGDFGTVLFSQKLPKHISLYAEKKS